VPPATGKGLIVVRIPNAPIPEISSDDEGLDRNRWIRSVVSNNGQLRCTVSNAVDNLSSSGDTESLIADTVKGLFNTYLAKRSAVIDETGLLVTPLHVVKKLAAGFTEEIHCEGTAFPNGFNRMELFSGNVRGTYTHALLITAQFHEVRIGFIFSKTLIYM